MDNIIDLDKARANIDRWENPMEVFGSSDTGYHSLLRNTVKFTYDRQDWGLSSWSNL